MARFLRNRRTLSFLVLVVFAALIGLAAVSSQASSEIAAATSGVFTGTDSAGDFQAALEDAVADAVAAAGCCDILVNYEVLETTGRVGGLLGLDEISVKIYAKW